MHHTFSSSTSKFTFTTWLLSSIQKTWIRLLLPFCPLMQDNGGHKDITIMGDLFEPLHSTSRSNPSSPYSESKPSSTQPLLVLTCHSYSSAATRRHYWLLIYSHQLPEEGPRRSTANEQCFSVISTRLSYVEQRDQICGATVTTNTLPWSKCRLGYRARV